MATRGRKVLMTCKCGGNFIRQGSEEEKVLLVCNKCGKTKKVLVVKMPKEEMPETPVAELEEKTED